MKLYELENIIITRRRRRINEEKERFKVGETS